MFDVLNVKTPLFGAKVLEASAGTGKTFAIEHLFVRLLLEAPSGEEPLLAEQILAITFTKAAAREMRMRIHANLRRALAALKEGASWSYLQPHVGSIHSERLLEDALIGFDRAQIFTIHGFCQRMLAEFSLEAQSIQTTREETPFRKAARPVLLDFLETQQVLCPEQLGSILASKRRDAMSSLCDSLLNTPAPSTGGSFSEDFAALQQIPSHWDLYEEFERLQPYCKITDFKGDHFEEQLACLKDLSQEKNFRRLLFWKGSLLKFLSLGNRKKRAKETPPTPIFDECSKHLLPILEKAIDSKILFQRLRFAWQKPFVELLETKGIFSPDFLLERMRRALDHPAFIAAIQNKYRAAIIDEFQDTDAIQWEIFSRLFIKQRLFYLVGDPKQSIYRFRQADLYTYFNARKTLKDHATLDTNYRSSPHLICALNDLFGEEHTHPWLWLPRENRTESYLPIKAGAEISWNPGDGKHPLQFFTVLDLGAHTLSYVVQEIVRLRPHFPKFGSFALLVKDRHQANEAISFLQERALPCWFKSQSPLGETLAMQAWEELFEALFSPRDISKLKIFLAGPFIGRSADQLLEEAPFLPQLHVWKSILEQGGLPAFSRAFLADPVVYERMRQRGSVFFRDVFQILEYLLQIRSPTLETLRRAFRELETTDPEEDPSARRYLENDGEAIQIMTMHSSKGLEFDVVFALGAAAKTPRADEEPQEIEAEKLRQLYVALTRAKFRLYIPLLEESSKEATESPLELFWRRSKLGADPEAIVQRLADKNQHIGLDTARSRDPFEPLLEIQKAELNEPPLLSLTCPKRQILSYSALSKGEPAHLPSITSEEKNLHTLPRGAETGVILHRILERVFREKLEPQKIVTEELRLSKLKNWEAVIQELVKKILSLPLIKQLDPSQLGVEIEFLFSERPHFLKGFIDLAFILDDRLYFLDWKTNWLGNDSGRYSQERLFLAMEEGDYWLQASLYAQALQRAWSAIPFGGAYYFFLRGIDASGNGILFFQPGSLKL